MINGFENPQLPVILVQNELMFFEWGLVPMYVTNPIERKKFREKYNTLNAKGETIFTSKMYSEAIRQRSCLVICSGFFEWHEQKGKKYSYYITLKDDNIFVFGGIYNQNTNVDTGEITRSFSIITIPANELMEKIHNTKKRMPLIHEPENALRWLDKDLREEEVKEFFYPIESNKIKAHTIKKFIPSKTDEFNSPDLLAYYYYPELSELVDKQRDLFNDI